METGYARLNELDKEERKKLNKIIRKQRKNLRRGGILEWMKSFF